MTAPDVRGGRRTPLHQSPVTSRSEAGRRLGFTIGAVVNATMLWIVNEWPGWQAVPFLTPDTRLVLGLVNASIVVGLLANLLCAVALVPRVRALTDLAQNAVGIAAMVRIWQVFPFDFGSGGFDWDLLARWLLGVGIVGSVIGSVAALVRLVRGR